MEVHLLQGLDQVVQVVQSVGLHKHTANGKGGGWGRNASNRGPAVPAQHTAGAQLVVVA
jgi:hypothetical protein